MNDLSVPEVTRRLLLLKAPFKLYDIVQPQPVKRIHLQESVLLLSTCGSGSSFEIYIQNPCQITSVSIGRDIVASSVRTYTGTTVMLQTL